MSELLDGVEEALIKAGWTPPNGAQHTTKDVLIELLENNELDDIFDRTLKLEDWAKNKYETHLSEFSDEQIRYEYLDRGYVDFSEQIKLINWRRKIGLDASAEIEELLKAVDE